MKLEWQNINKTYGQKTAVNNFSLVAQQGKLLVLIGPSGCGKTTILKMINRLVEPDSGKIMVDDQDISTLPISEHRRRIGYSIQQVGLFPHLNVAENIATVPRLLKWNKDRIHRRVCELLDLVGLPPKQYAHAWPNRLSGGEIQRIGVARALAADPPILLMDEPFGAVDPITREILQTEFLQIQSELGKTVVFVTHDLDEAFRLGDRIALMNKGTLISESIPEGLLQNDNPFVRDFTGEDRVLRWLSRKQVQDIQNDELMPNRSNIHTSIRNTATLKEALALMLEEGLSSLQVTDLNGMVIGNITINDLIEIARMSEAS